MLPGTRSYQMKRKLSHPSAPPAKKKKMRGDYQKGRELTRPGQELKAFDVAYTNINFETVAGPPGQTPALNAMINGSEIYQRIGRKVYMKSLHIRGWIAPIATGLSDVGRIIVYYDSQPNAAAATIVNIIQDSNAAAATTALSEINLTNRQRFKILRDHQIQFPSVSDAAGVLTNEAFPETYQGHTNIEMFIKLKGLEAIYNSTNGGTIADITSGAIGIIVVCEVNNSSWQLGYTSRLRFYD